MHLPHIFLGDYEYLLNYLEKLVLWFYKLYFLCSFRLAAQVVCPRSWSVGVLQISGRGWAWKQRISENGLL